MTMATSKTQITTAARLAQELRYVDRDLNSMITARRLLLDRFSRGVSAANTKETGAALTQKIEQLANKQKVVSRYLESLDIEVPADLYRDNYGE